jgi:hypothetical protein
VSTKVQALLHLVQIKMAGGEYAAAWDARNAVNRMREAGAYTRSLQSST